MGGVDYELNRALTHDLLDIESLNSLANILGERPNRVPDAGFSIAST